ncbi:MAG: hypothetical protein WBC63_02030 [Candidatus Bipolaricaulia bacterium]
MKRALVLGCVCVLALAVVGFPEGLSGEWNLDIELDTLAGNVQDYLDYSSTLLVVYEIDGWEFSSNSTFDDTGWTDQSFSAEGALYVYEIGSRLDFAPGGLFEKLNFDVSFPLAGLVLGMDFELKDRDVEFVIDAEGSTDLIDLELSVSFGGDDNDFCDLPWSGVDVDVSLPFCCGDFDVSIEFSCDGFEEACFDVSGVAIPNLPWLSLNAGVCFDMQSKSVTLTPVFDFGVDVCFDLYITEVEDGGHGPNAVLVLGDFVISGIGLSCEIAGVSFVGQSYWGAGGKPSLLSGTEYWEAYQLSTMEEACCGPFQFDVSVFFGETSDSLFDVAGFGANFSVGIGEKLTFSMGYDYSVVAPGLQLITIGFEVKWW